MLNSAYQQNGCGLAMKGYRNGLHSSLVHWGYAAIKAICLVHQNNSRAGSLLTGNYVETFSFLDYMPNYSHKIHTLCARELPK